MNIAASTDPSLPDAPSLRQWLDQAHEQHARQPQAVAEGLLARAAALPDDDEGTEAIQLAEHVWLGHLGHQGPAAVNGLQQFLQRLPAAAAALQPARERAAWVLATLQGDAQAMAILPPPALRWRALQNLVLALVAQGRVDEAAQRLAAPAREAMAHVEPAARKAYAASCNNVASDLREGLERPASGPRDARVALMLEAAALARQAWAAAGTWLHVERAEYQLALCHAAAGDGAAALRHGRACLSICEAEGADAAERFFAHEALVHAQRAACDLAAAAQHRAGMLALLPEVEADLQAWCRETLAALPE